jgi:hypothetical protein
MSEPNYPDYPGNSNADKEKKANLEVRKKSTTTVKATKKKKTLGQKFSDVFLCEDMATVKGYILNDVIIPGLKDAFEDIITSSISMMLHGSNGGRPNTRRGNTRSGSGTLYYQYAKNNNQKSQPNRSGESARNHIDQVVFDSREEANQVLDCMVDYLMDYSTVSVADFYDFANVSSDWTDQKWGWYDLREARVIKTRDGWELRLPRPEPIS